jgi:hypothetical protein
MSHSVVLGSYKRLLRTIFITFEHDTNTLHATRSKIREEYHLNQGVTDHEQILQLIERANQTSQFLKDAVIQAQIETTDQKVAKVNIRLNDQVRNQFATQDHIYLEPAEPEKKRRKESIRPCSD